MRARLPPYYRYTSWSLISRISLRARRQTFRCFLEALRPKATDEVVDVGVTCDCGRPESNFFEALYPHRERITATSIEDARAICQLFPGVRFVPCRAAEPLPFADQQFDLAFCNAVLEHVGETERQRDFVHEVVRISRRGLIATPYRYFPIEAHTSCLSRIGCRDPGIGACCEPWASATSRRPASCICSTAASCWPFSLPESASSSLAPEFWAGPRISWRPTGDDSVNSDG